jgi:hypothetical protein
MNEENSHLGEGKECITNYIQKEKAMQHIVKCKIIKTDIMSDMHI